MRLNVVPPASPIITGKRFSRMPFVYPHQCGDAVGVISLRKIQANASGTSKSMSVKGNADDWK